jgi:transposase
MATKLTKEDKIAKAKELHQSGLSCREIGGMLRVNKSTAYNYVNDYAYKR